MLHLNILNFYPIIYNQIPPADISFEKIVFFLAVFLVVQTYDPKLIEGSVFFPV